MHQTGVYAEQCVEAPSPPPCFTPLQTQFLEAKTEECTFPHPSCITFSPQHLIWASVFLAISSSHTDQVARVIEREREGEANLAANTGTDFKATSNITAPLPSSPGPVFSYFTFLTLDVCLPLLWFCLNTSLTVSFQETPQRHTYIQTDITQGYRLCL